MRVLARFVFFLFFSLAPVFGQSALERLLVETHRLMAKGEYEEAEKQLSENSAPQALRLRMELAERRGDLSASRALAQQLLNAYATGRLVTPEEVGQAAVAAWHLDRWHDANEIFMAAAKRAPVPASLYIDWGNLYLEQYNPAEAQSIFEDAIAAGPEQSPGARWGLEEAYLGLSQSLEGQGAPGSDKVLEKAVELNRDNPRLIAHQSTQAIQEGNWKEAEELLERGLKNNKNDLQLIGLKAAFHYFQFQEDDFSKARDRVLEINPSNGDFFETLGDLCVPRRRLQDAIDFYRESVRRNPRQWSALAALGINLLRIGEETEGTAVLERAYENDPFNLWTVNTLRLLDSFKNFTRFETPHFSAKIATSEVLALRPYVQELLERSITTLAEKYQFKLSGKYVFEMYNNHEDFAVRTLGMPGLGALGATFGRVVAMDSPSARPGGKFHWASTLWHEVAHIVTLGLSEQKVPRWLTEGLSMMEERLAVEGWGDFLNPNFVQAYKEKKLLSLAVLDEGFQRPKFPGQVELSYFQAGWVCDFLASRYGAEKIRAMLVAFGEDKTPEEVFKEVLGASVEEVDREFQKVMDETLQPLVAKLEPPEALQAGEALELGLLRLAAENDPDNYYANLAVAGKLIENDQGADAIPYLEKAIEIFPFEAGPASPYARLVELYRKQGDSDLELKTLRRWWKVAPRFASVGMDLASRLKPGENAQEAIETLQGVMYVDPLKPEPHRMLGELYLKNGQDAEAVSEFRILLSLQPPDIAGAHFRLADALAVKGESDEARRHVLLALEIAPGYSEAQKLLLKLVRQ